MVCENDFITCSKIRIRVKIPNYVSTIKARLAKLLLQDIGIQSQPESSKAGCVITMTSILPLDERLQQPLKRPKELISYSLHYRKPVLDNSALKYYYFPRNEAEKKLDLSDGYQNFEVPDRESEHLDVLLWSIMEYEKVNGRLDVDVISWRGIFVELMILTSERHEDYSAIVTSFDNQIFINKDDAARKIQFKIDLKRNPELTRFMYSGYNFEKFATLNKPWGECTREEIENRYKGTCDLDHEYGVLIQSGIGNVKLAYGAEVDCVEGAKDPNNPQKHYVELKTTKAIWNSRHAEQFEHKLMRSWLQSYMAGVPKIVYGFRDQNFKLIAVEEFETLKIPLLIKHSRVTPPHKRWDGKDYLQFLAVFVAWIKDTVKSGETWKLLYIAGNDHLRLSKTDYALEPPRKVSFLSDEFVRWRYLQKHQSEA